MGGITGEPPDTPLTTAAFGLSAFALAAENEFMCMNTELNNSLSANASKHIGGTQACQGGKSHDWRSGIRDLADKFLRYREMRDSEEREEIRGEFYESFRNLSLSAARTTLGRWSWKGDRHQDAQEIASRCVETLLKQEQTGAGIFDSALGGGKLKGYLNRTVWKGARQRAASILRKESRFGSLDERVFSIRDHRQDAESVWKDVQVVRERLAARIPGKYRTPAGRIPLDGVINRALAVAGERKLHEEAGIARRTWQREEQAARELLRQRLVSSPVWSQGRQDARRKVRRQLDLE